MPNLVQAGAICMCSYGKSPFTLQPLAPGKVKSAGVVLTVKDVPQSGPLFGMCNSPANPATKNPSLSGPCNFTVNPASPMWVPGSSKVTIGGMPALTNSSMLACFLGAPGCITLLPNSPGVVATVQAT